MSAESFKIAFIGSHGVGKTTLCYGLAARLKARDVSLDVVGETARRCPLPINRDTTSAAQAWILHTQIAEELLAGTRHDVVICDRSVLDNFVYLLIAAGPQASLEGLVTFWTRTYDFLVHVPIVAEPRPDGLRSTDPVFQRAVDERLVQELAERKIPALELSDIERGAWLDRVEKAVWEYLRPGQLELL
ncbi:MAG: ATP-binding protein [bacterium]|nr:ATP-binding protein [bacterium]